MKLILPYTLPSNLTKVCFLLHLIFMHCLDVKFISIILVMWAQSRVYVGFLPCNQMMAYSSLTPTTVQ